MSVYLTVDEQNRILEATAEGFSVSRIAAMLNRHRRTIERVLEKISDGDETVPTKVPDQYIIEDRRFRKAMMKAIKAGKERAHIGVVADNTSIPVNRFNYFYHAQAFSMYGSPAATCAEIGDNPKGAYDVYKGEIS